MILLLDTLRSDEAQGFDVAVVTIDEETKKAILRSRDFLHMTQAMLDGHVVAMTLIHTGDVKYYDDPQDFADPDLDPLTPKQREDLELQGRLIVLDEAERKRIFEGQEPTETDRDLLMIERDHFYWWSASIDDTDWVETQAIPYDVLSKEPEKT